MKDFTLYTSTTTGSKNNLTYPIPVHVTDVEALREAVRHDHVCAKYRGDRRGKDNFEASDCVTMDCDNDHSENPAEWKTPDDVAAAFPQAAFMVAYSRNHMKEKNGKAARPKFHVYFPVKTVTDANRYVALKAQLLRAFPWFDANAKDAARFFFGTADPQVALYDGTKTVDELLAKQKTIPAGSRNSTLSHVAGHLVTRYGNTDKARELFLEEAAKCVPPLDRDELHSIWNSAKKFGERIAASDGYRSPAEYNAKSSVREFLDTVRPERNPLYAWTDIGASRLFADCFKATARYVPERKCWYIYKDGIWTDDVGGLKVMELCKELADELTVYALSISDEHQKQEYLKHCTRWQNRHVREVFLKDAQSIHPISMNEFDADPYIFNCKNGTLHLDAMEFAAHSPDDRLTKMSGAEYDPKAKCERFLTFVDEICSGDSEKAKFLQKMLGYGISGDTRHECFFILYGATTRNGKGTLCESVLKVLGTYGCTARPETISVKPVTNSQNPSEDIARLAGIRFANISEPGRGLQLNAAQIKSMTGNDTLNARFLHENSFDFKPQFKLYINTNYLPVTNDMTLFSSGRVIIIPFDRHFDESEQDKSLKKLFAKPENQSAILNWLAEGYRLLQTEGLQIPNSVKSATDEYRHDSDKIMQFVEEQLEEAGNAELRTSVVYEKYRTWCEQNGYYSESNRSFNQALRSVATVIRKRPRDGSSETTMLIGYKIAGEAAAL